MPNRKSIIPLFMKAALLTGAVLAAPAVSAQAVMTLPLYGTVDAVIDWGADGANATCTRHVTSAGEVTCNYPVSDGDGPFQVRISGTVTQFGNGDAGYSNADRITRVVRFGNVGLTSLSGAFKGAERLTDVPTDFPDTVTDISYAFKGAVLFNDPDVQSWGMKTRNVTNMTGAFENAVEFTQGLDAWCMKNVASAPARLRGLTLNGPDFTAIESRLQAHGVNVNLSRAMKMTETKEPRWGQCGLTIDATPPAAAQSGSSYSLNLKSRSSLWANAPADADLDQLTFQVASGTLPTGLTLDPNTGIISGTPTVAGTYNFTIRAVQN